MKTKLFVSLLFVSASVVSIAPAGTVKYTDPGATDSPAYGQKSPALTPDTQANQAHKNFVNDSGLYKNPYKNNPASSGNGTSNPASTATNTGAAQAPGASGSSQTYWKDGIEYDAESGVTTGNIEAGRDTTKSAGTASGTTEKPAAGANAGSAASATGGVSDNPLIASVDAIAALVSSASAQQVSLVVPGLAEMQQGKQGYASTRLTCHSDQMQAETICREKTNPGLQTTAMAINVLMSAANTMGVTDACSNTAKVMSLASAGLTAYTAACGILKAKCEIKCKASKKSLMTIQAGAAKPVTCTPINPMAAGACASILSQYTSHVHSIHTNLGKELNEADVSTIAGKSKICTYEYAGLIATAGISMISVVKSLREARDCDEDTDVDNNGSSTAAATASASTATTAVAVAPTPIGNTTTLEVAADGTTKVVGTQAVQKAAVTRETASSMSSADLVSSDSPYRAYLPGGEKDPLKGQGLNGSGSAPKEISGANGKTNFQKIREKFRSQESSLISP